MSDSSINAENNDIITVLLLSLSMLFCLKQIKGSYSESHSSDFSRGGEISTSGRGTLTSRGVGHPEFVALQGIPLTFRGRKYRMSSVEMW